MSPGTYSRHREVSIVWDLLSFKVENSSLGCEGMGKGGVCGELLVDWLTNYRPFRFSESEASFLLGGNILLKSSCVWWGGGVVCVHGVVMHVCVCSMCAWWDVYGICVCYMCVWCGGGSGVWYVCSMCARCGVVCACVICIHGVVVVVVWWCVCVCVCVCVGHEHV